MNCGRNMLQARLFRNLDKPGLKEGFKTRVLLTLQQTLILNSFVLQGARVRTYHAAQIFLYTQLF
jgi:hypothetical protein